MLNFYRHCFKKLPPTKTCAYSRHASEVLKPLYYIATTALSQKEFQKIWSENPEYKQAFEDSKLLVKNAVTLNHPDPQAPLALSTDSSQYAVGAVLEQFVNGSWRPLSFFSKSLKPSQQAYSTFKRELLAVFLAVRHFLPEFWGRHLIIYSDHKSLLGSFKNHNLQVHDQIASY